MLDPLLRSLTYADADADADGPRDPIAPGRMAATARLIPPARATPTPLPGDLRARFEASLDADLAAVRVHTGAASARAARAAGAHAFAIGDDIHFADGAYAPADPFGVHLLAHEVVHTVQQAGAAPRVQHKRADGTAPADAAEVEADRAAGAMVAGQPAALGRLPVTVSIREVDDEPVHFAAGSYASLLEQIADRLARGADVVRVTRALSARYTAGPGGRLRAAAYDVVLHTRLPEWKELASQPAGDQARWREWREALAARARAERELLRAEYAKLEREVTGPTEARAAEQAALTDGMAIGKQTTFIQSPGGQPPPPAGMPSDEPSRFAVIAAGVLDGLIQGAHDLGQQYDGPTTGAEWALPKVARAVHSKDGPMAGELVDDYLGGVPAAHGGPARLHLTAAEMHAMSTMRPDGAGGACISKDDSTFSVFDPRLAPRMARYLDAARATEGGAIEVHELIAGLNNELGHFDVQIAGTLRRLPDGRLRFEGTMQWSDFWVFNPDWTAWILNTRGDPLRSRNFSAELITDIIAVIARGQPFAIDGDPMPLDQSEGEAPAGWVGRCIDPG